MKLFGILLLVCRQIWAGKLFIKVVQLPIYDNNQICAQHHIVLLNTVPFEQGQQEYDDVYAVDFSPSNDITDCTVAIQLLLGKTMPGKIRFVYFDHISDDQLFRESLRNRPTAPIQLLEYIDCELYYKIVDWDPVFQLYMRNCQHFGRYLHR